jgi:hypothetical protein
MRVEPKLGWGSSEQKRHLQRLPYLPTGRTLSMSDDSTQRSVVAALAVAHRYRERLPCLSPLDRHPFEEAIDRKDASATRVGFAEQWQARDCLCCSVHRFAAALRVLAPLQDQAQRNGSNETSPVSAIAPNDQQLLARCRVVSWRMIGQSYYRGRSSRPQC